jgi:hypothetical protein
MPSLSYTLKAKGFTKTVKRAMRMVNRDGFSSTEKIEGNIVDFAIILGIERLIVVYVSSGCLNQIEGENVT